MRAASKFSPYSREKVLATAPARDKAVALRLCKLLEAAFPVSDISIYSGFPVVVRDMEWIAGFAMRVRGPIAYCCSKEVMQLMGKELAPFQCGKSCLDVRARNGATLDDVLALVGRAFKEASKHGGMICKADIKKREKLRAAAAAGAAEAPLAKGKKATSASTKKSSTKKTTTKTTTKTEKKKTKAPTKKAPTKKAPTKKTAVASKRVAAVKRRARA